MASLNDVLRVFRRMPGDWRVASAVGGVSRAVRDDGLALDLRLLRGGQLQVDPAPLATADGGRSGGPAGRMPMPVRLNMARGPAHVAGKLERGLLRELEKLRAGAPGAEEMAEDMGAPGPGGADEASAGGDAAPGEPKGMDGRAGGQEGEAEDRARKESGEARGAGNAVPVETADVAGASPTDKESKGWRGAGTGNAGANGAGGARPGDVGSPAELLLASRLAKEVPSRSGERSEFRLLPPFAGEAVIEEDGTVRLLITGMHPDLAASLFRRMAEEAGRPMPDPARASAKAEPPRRDGSRPAMRSRQARTREGILRAFREAPGTTQSDVARQLGIAQQTVSKHVRSLREEGLLPRANGGGGGQA